MHVPPTFGSRSGIGLPSRKVAPRFDAGDVQSLVGSAAGARHDTAVKLHDVLASMRREGRLNAVSGVQIDEQALRQMLDDPNGLVRSVAVAVAGCTGDRKWVSLCGRLVREDLDPFVRTRAVEALGHLRALESVPLLIEVAESSPHPARYHAVRALGRMGEATAAELLRLAFDNDDGMVRSVAADTIARTASAETWQRFLSAMEENRPVAVRKSLVAGLGRSRTVRAAPPLVRAMVEDPEPEVREAAVDALVALGETRTAGALYECALYDGYFVDNQARPPLGAGDAGRQLQAMYPVREAASEALLVLGGIMAWEELESPEDNLVDLPGARD